MGTGLAYCIPHPLFGTQFLHQKIHATPLIRNTTRFAEKQSKNSKIGQITTAFWRIFARLNISSYPEFAGEQATEHGKLTSI